MRKLNGFVTKEEIRILMSGKIVLVDIESPYAGNVETNICYARDCMRDSLKRGEFPLASHLLYTQPGILNDAILEERNLGIAAGKAWAEHAHLTAIYTDLGISIGMKGGIKNAEQRGRRVVYRSIPEWKKKKIKSDRERKE